MALITEIIPEQNFEKVRDRIAEILALEIPNQATLQGNTDINAAIYAEKFTPFDKTELPAINVSLGEGEFLTNTTTHSDGVYDFFIDAYTGAKTNSNEGGYLKSSKLLHKLLGIVRYIFEDPQYRRLGFQPPSIKTTSVKTIQVLDPKNNQDAVSVMMGRITFEVQVNETEELLDAPNIVEFITSVKMDETDSGYVFTESV